jgi:hypothetical protein
MQPLSSGKVVLDLLQATNVVIQVIAIQNNFFIKLNT